MCVRNRIQISLTAIVLLVAASTAVAQEWKSGVEWQEPPLVTPGATHDAAPSDAIVLFDGTNLNQWVDGENWLIEDGVAYLKSHKSNRNNTSAICSCISNGRLPQKCAAGSGTR